MKITTIFNQELEIKDCIGCHLVNTDFFKDGLISQTNTMQLSLDLELSYPGMMILSPKRHVEYFDQLTTDEANEWNKLLAIATKALRQDSDCIRISYFFRSFTGYHMHLAIMPIWKDSVYQDSQTILSDLIKDCKKLRKENIQKVILYKDKLQTKINSYIV
ncbi:MAG: hypothetical protein J6Y03_03855 [Alphaproteobacteria bacterium]|nr:hypothetical protein [Alphaproteobacteria bacterium]